MLSFIGFTAGGVAASSTAAAWQASIGNVAAGSLFAAFQSAGATGIGLGGWALPATVLAAAGAYKARASRGADDARIQ